MSYAIEVFMDNIIRIVTGGLALIAFIIILLFTITMNNAKLTINKAMDEIEDRMDKIGHIEEDYVYQQLDEYCTGISMRGYEITEVSPGFGVIPEYIGQPLYVEARLDYTVAGRDFTVKGKAQSYNRGYYGKGYNTINQH